MLIDRNGNAMEFEEALQQLLFEHGYREFEPPEIAASSQVRKKMNRLLHKLKKAKVCGFCSGIVRSHQIGALESWIKKGSYMPEELRKLEKFVQRLK